MVNEVMNNIEINKLNVELKLNCSYTCYKCGSVGVGETFRFDIKGLISHDSMSEATMNYIRNHQHKYFPVGWGSYLINSKTVFYCSACLED